MPQTIPFIFLINVILFFYYFTWLFYSWNFISSPLCFKKNKVIFRVSVLTKTSAKKAHQDLFHHCQPQPMSSSILETPDHGVPEYLGSLTILHLCCWAEPTQEQCLPVFPGKLQSDHGVGRLELDVVAYAWHLRAWSRKIESLRPAWVTWWGLVSKLK